MIEKRILIHLQEGLQARNCTQFVEKSFSFTSHISIIKNERMVDGKSIMGVMALAIRQGEEITLYASGSDEQKAITDLEDFLLGNE